MSEQNELDWSWAFPAEAAPVWTSGEALRAHKKARFLEALATTGTVARAIEAADIAWQTAYNWRDADPAFAEAWTLALDRGVDVLLDQARLRAFAGVADKYSATLLMFLIKGSRPQYRDGNQINVNAGFTTVQKVAQSLDEAEKIAATPVDEDY